MKRILLTGLLALTACTPYLPSPRYVGKDMYAANVPVSRLEGRWYEVAGFPAVFQQGCRNTTADFASRSDGLMAVRHQCRDKATGQLRQADAVASSVGPGQFAVTTPGQLFASGFLVLDMSPDGKMVLIGTHTRLTGWVLKRDRRVTPEELDFAREVFKRNGYDIASLQRTHQR
jgi:apolipoprotein D and lipocalin family protein